MASDLHGVSVLPAAIDSSVVPYDCRSHDVKFQSLHELKWHLSLAHPFGEIFFCDFCGHAAKTEADMDDHLTGAHQQLDSGDEIVKDEIQDSSPEEDQAFGSFTSDVREVNSNPQGDHRPVTGASANELLPPSPQLPANTKNDSEVVVKDPELSEDSSNDSDHDDVLDAKEEIDASDNICGANDDNFFKTDPDDKHLPRRGEVKCKWCQKVFSKTANLRTHVQSIHLNLRSFKCPQCPFSASTNSNLKVHIASHAEEKHKCDICTFKSSYRSSLKEHMESHINEEAHKCNTCSFSASTASSLQRHMRIHLTGSVKRLKCPHDKCSYSCNYMHDLKTHLNTHTNERRFICEQCPFAATTSCSLKRHSFIHSGERNFKCSVCPYSTVTSVALKRHSATHTREKPFRCETCQFATVSKSVLHAHSRRMHSGEKRSKSAKKSSSKSASVKQQTVSRVTKRHSCSKCNFSSTVACNLKRHMKIHDRQEMESLSAGSGVFLPLDSGVENVISSIGVETEETVEEMWEKCADSTAKRIRLESISSQAATDGDDEEIVIVLHQIHSLNENGENEIAYEVEKVTSKSECQLCPYIAKRHEDFKKHMNRHTGKGRFKCELCSFSVNKRHNLTKHKKYHAHHGGRYKMVIDKNTTSLSHSGEAQGVSELPAFPE